MTQLPGLLDTEAITGLLRRFEPDVIIHAAASGGHPMDAAQRRAAWRDTVDATGSLWDAIEAASCHARVVHLGSSLECRPSDRPLREDDPLEPVELDQRRTERDHHGRRRRIDRLPHPENHPIAAGFRYFRQIDGAVVGDLELFSGFDAEHTC